MKHESFWSAEYFSISIPVVCLISVFLPNSYAFLLPLRRWLLLVSHEIKELPPVKFYVTPQNILHGVSCKCSFLKLLRCGLLRFGAVYSERLIYETATNRRSSTRLNWTSRYLGTSVLGATAAFFETRSCKTLESYINRAVVSVPGAVCKTCVK